MGLLTGDGQKWSDDEKKGQENAYFNRQQGYTDSTRWQACMET